MFEYECLGCGKKYYSTVTYDLLDDYKCDYCNDIVFYSVDELKNQFHRSNTWFKEQYNLLRKRENEVNLEDLVE